MPPPTPILWHLEISHYNEKVRWALDYKGVAHVRRAVTPGLQELRARRLRAGRTVPVLEMDGRAIGDSTRIIEEIERRWPEPPLYPADPEERSRALDLSREAALPDPAGDRREVAREGARGVRRDRGRRRPERPATAGRAPRWRRRSLAAEPMLRP
jgi:glutathione S-transferase